MAYHQARRMWTRLLVIGVVVAACLIVRAVFFGASPVGGELAGAYLLIVAVARARAVDRSRRATPARLKRVQGQLERVRSTLVDEAP